MEGTQGEVSEWLKELAWKAGVRAKTRTEGSNPSLSAQAGTMRPAFFILPQSVFLFPSVYDY